jgi:hypothetical protein
LASFACSGSIAIISWLPVVLVQHLGDMIRRCGMVWNYWMVTAELAHKVLLKNYLREYSVQ